METTFATDGISLDEQDIYDFFQGKMTEFCSIFLTLITVTR